MRRLYHFGDFTQFGAKIHIQNSLIAEPMLLPSKLYRNASC